MLILKVNDTTHQVDVPGDMPLLWVLRDILKLTGTKFGCGIAQCGACTVHLDGKPVRSCVLPVQSVSGHEITTIEGVSEKPLARQVQRAWLDHEVAQCGYCQSGQIMSAVALLNDQAPVNDHAINLAMAGNLCRCATYTRIRAAIREVSESVGVWQP